MNGKKPVNRTTRDFEHSASYAFHKGIKSIYYVGPLRMTQRNRTAINAKAV